MPPILEVEELVKKYGDFAAVKGISFRVEEGEIFGLLGPNGAGKTQSISMITGVFPPTGGTVRISGHDIHKDPQVVKQITGLVPQDLALYPTLSARANLMFFGRIYGLGGKELHQRVEDVLRIVALTERADQAIEKYSGGMKRRVNIAAGLVHQPQLLFLDEPTVGVDPQSRNNIFESVQHLNRERGMSIVYTSHYMEEVELLCNRVAIIDQGQIIALDTIKNLIDLLGGGIIRVGLRNVSAEILKEIEALPAVKSARLVPQPQLSSPSMAEDDTSSQLAAEPVAVERSSSTSLVELEAYHSQEALVNLMNYLNQQSYPIVSLEILEPNLESVFLVLTGKKLRE
jgi:ABC-2 type transport system ATP-binding protein